MVVRRDDITTTWYCFVEIVRTHCGRHVFRVRKEAKLCMQHQLTRRFGNHVVLVYGRARVPPEIWESTLWQWVSIVGRHSQGSGLRLARQ